MGSRLANLEWSSGRLRSGIPILILFIVCILITNLVLTRKRSSTTEQIFEQQDGDCLTRLWISSPGRSSRSLSVGKKEGTAAIAVTTTPSVSHMNRSLAEIHTKLYSYLAKVKSKGNAACPKVPEDLVGKAPVYQKYFPLHEVNKLDFRLMPGGSYFPPDCVATYNLAVIIPYRSRERHLPVLLQNLHPFLQRQQVAYTVFLVEQTLGVTFNKAVMMNVGFTEAMKRKKFDCIVFNDVDMLPQNDRILYRCPTEYALLHLGAFIDKFNYRLPYPEYIGGATAIRPYIFRRLNGFSNLFFGWGREDDDLYERCGYKGICITRYPESDGHYEMISHSSDSGNTFNPHQDRLMQFSKTRQDTDGLNTLSYTVLSITDQPLYTHLYVSINETEIMGRHPDIARILQTSHNEQDHRLDKKSKHTASNKAANDCEPSTVKSLLAIINTQSHS